MTALSVNVNKVAVLRNSRGGATPDVVHAATACLDAGAHGITVHPRPDARHIRADDVHALAALTRARGVDFNIEGNPFAPPRAGYPGLLALCEAARPAQATLVPDGDGQLTSDHGFDFRGDLGELRALVAALKALGCRVSLFVDAGDPRVIFDDGEFVVLDTIRFNTGLADVHPSAHSLLDQVALTLRAYPEIEHIRIEGHTDDTGPRELNMALSQRRALAVKHYLVRLGVSPRRLTLRSYGPDRPREAGTDRGARAQNRRVEFIVE